MGEPSKVIHVRNVPGEVTEAELHLLAQQFGPVSKVVNIRSKNQALLQMADLQHSIAMMQYYTEVQPTIRGSKVYMQFSSHQELTSSDSNGRSRVDQEQQPNRILLVTIHNPLYPINVDVLQQVFSPHGFVEKIVTFTKSAGLQALLQYSNQQSAVQARNTLQGRNIYDGCCTLDIQFSNLSDLQVHFNNDKTRDFTNNQLPEGGNGRGPLGAPGGPVVTSLFGDGGNAFGMHHQQPRQGYPQGPVPPQGPGPMSPYQVQVPGMNPLGQVGPAGGFGQPNMGMPGMPMAGDKCTLLVSNLNTDEINPDKLFNLFSNYGNVARIKMLHNKPDHALVELADGYQAELAVNYLKGVNVFGKRMDVSLSKHAHINPSPDTRDFTSSQLNRFTRNAAKNYRHCTAPTRMLHASSLSQDITGEALTELLQSHGTILGAKVFDKEGKKQALILFQSSEEATNALIAKHATPLGAGTIRLAFSKNTAL
eukprot:TRINITY_DN679_c0_g1_i2.p1 TRINITY_DN679_c0_g1~~TRINITY_DN679_c0_g1_i2.p1  ORF type:complete len:480 (-),score=76.09 TRINITY_DN679_c0_g1_i2:516-1955(-)